MGEAQYEEDTITALKRYHHLRWSQNHISLLGHASYLSQSDTATFQIPSFMTVKMS
ncbi:MAG: hypothetical protein IPL23_02600 [Saprospiraceae bacterium]|nr:hypothetical protein [Saprospiraceae bacterium]